MMSPRRALAGHRGSFDLQQHSVLGRTKIQAPLWTGHPNLWLNQSESLVGHWIPSGCTVPDHTSAGKRNS